MDYAYLNANAPIYIALACVFFTAIAVGLHFLAKKDIKISKWLCFATLGVFLVARIIIAWQTEGHSDMTSFFLPWSYKLANGGFFSFYLADIEAGTIEYLNDYPPMLMYLLWLFGTVVKNFSLSNEMWIFLMRLPAIFCDVVCAYYILKIAIDYQNKKASKSASYKSRKEIRANGNAPKENPETAKSVSLAKFPSKVSIFAFACMVMYLLNPAMITDSAWWGQVDGVIAMFFAITIYNLQKGNDKAVVVTAIVAMCYKLQYIFFMPALGMYYLVRLKDEKSELFSKLLKGVIIGAAVFLCVNLPLCFMPMIKGHPFFMINIYINQVSNYAYYTLNAPNLFGALNLNFIQLSNNGTAWTLFVVGGVSIVVACLSLTRDKEKKVPILGALTIITVFMFSYKMHERYMIYALVLLLIVYVQSGKLADLMIYCGFTCVQFFTIASIMCIDGSTFNFYDKRLQIISIICLTLYFLYVILISQAEVSARKSQLHKTLKK
ncbi:MAG: hypothetical protein R3Y45_08185 [Bacillota bacterium]